MSRPTIARRGRQALTLATVAGVAIATLATSGSAQAIASPAATPDAAPLAAGDYIVTLAAPPVASYRGGVPGMAATRPAAGKRLDARSADAQRYGNHLRGQQSALMKRAGVRAANQQYTIATNGFAAKLTAVQANKLAADSGVLSVTRDTLRKPDLYETPRLLGMQGPTGGWAQVGGQDKAGKGVVVGIIDSGVWPENPFFAGERIKRTTPGGVGSVYQQSGAIHVVKKDGAEFTGTCQPGEQFYATTCNTKLVGARFYNRTFKARVPRDQWREHKFDSPRDGDGHGSHTSSTAVGNPINRMVVAGREFGRSSGMAPAAKLATYKVCWEAVDPNAGGCFTSDTLTAIDDAVKDGVDVLNFSIGGGSPESSTDSVERAFLTAADAGIFVAASAGNSGPGASTVGHNSPWLTTVAATTAHRFENTVQLGNGTKLRGASFSDQALPATPAILGSAGAAAGDAGAQAGFCVANSLDPAKVTGKIVVCDRGVNDRVAKSAEVARAGGVGLVMTNPTENTLNADVHSVPTIHLSHTQRPAVMAYLATPNPTIAFLLGDQTGAAPTPIPVTAGFSSRGPDLTSGGDLLKPDITAPGVDIIAAVAPGPHRGDNFDVLSGTSMSSPHIAGLAALILGKNPRWSPAAVKSAMMTTATDTRTDAGGRSTDAFGQGAGFVNPKAFLEPGLVYEAGTPDYLSYLEGIGVDTGSGLPAIDTSDLNLPSIAIGSLAGSQTVTRTVTALKSGTYRATVRVPGVQAQVTPSVLHLRKGQSASFTVKFTTKSATLDTYTTGHLTWASGRTAVRSPIAIQPVTVAAPAEVTGTGTSGSASYQVTSGTSGSLDLSVHGLVAGDVNDDTVEVGESKTYPVTVPDGTTHARFDLVAGNQADDLDLAVFEASDLVNPIGVSASGAASERVDLSDLPAGDYVVEVAGFASADPASAYSLRTFLVPEAAAGNLTATPDPLPVTQSQPATVTVAWSGLTAGTPYLGWVGYNEAPARTLVTVG